MRDIQELTSDMLKQGAARLEGAGKGFSLAVLAGLLAGSLFLIVRMEQVNHQVAQLRQENSSLGMINQGLALENRALAQEKKRLAYVQDLAIEFSIDPSIVSIVDRYSREYMAQPGPEWRLLRTPEFLTYIVLSVIYAESKGNPEAVGDGGRARGLTQIWVSTAREYGEVTAEQLHNPETNISFAFKHFHSLLQKYRGNLALALYAWNRGSRRVDNLLSYGQSPANGYGQRIYEAALLNNRNLPLSLAE